MHGDFSRWTFRPSRGYSRVLMQQGRVQLDADWNEQATIQFERLRTLAVDLVGREGGPAGEALGLVGLHALDFDGGAGHVLGSQAPVFEFAERRPFTLSCHVMPGERGGPLLSHGDDRGRLGWCLDVDAAGRPGFSRVEAWELEEPAFLVEEGFVGSTAVERIEVEVEVAVRRTLRAHRRLARCGFSHVVVTFDGSETRIYVDGELAAADLRAGRAVPCRGALRLGAAPGHGGLATLHGSLADVRIHARALGPRHVGSGGEEGPDLVGWWTFDEPDGDRVVDRSRHGHDARILHDGTGSPRRRHEVWITEGRYYVDGLVCESGRAVRLEPREALRDGADTDVLAVLDAWEQFVSVVQDPDLAEAALGGPDTAGRSRTAWQVRCVPLRRREGEPPGSEVLDAWHELRRGASQHGRLQARFTPRGLAPHDGLYRVEIHDGPCAPHAVGVRPSRVDAVDADRHAVRLAGTEAGRFDWRAGQLAELLARPRQAGPTERAEATVVSVDAEARWLVLDPWPAELLEAGSVHVRRVPTFKWSRDNGAVAFPILGFERGSATLRLGLAGRTELPLRPGDALEIADDGSALAGRPGPIVMVRDLDAGEGRVTVSGWDPAADMPLASHPFVRRWDSGADAAGGSSGVLPVRIGQWIPLERGLEVSFSGDGLYCTSDYWLIPSRSLSNGIEWPLDGREPCAMRPSGPCHVLAPLARLRAEGDGLRVVESFAKVFGPAARRAPE